MKKNQAWPSRLDRISTSWSLLAQAHAGPQDAAAAARALLVERYRGAVRRYLGALLRDDQAADDLTQEFGLALIPYNPLAGGLLTGKHQAAEPLPDSRFTRMPIYRDRYWHDANFAAVQELAEVAAAEGRSLARLAIRWVVSQPGVASVILGASRLEHLHENFAALEDPPITPESLAACDRVWSTLRGVTPKYNR